MNKKNILLIMPENPHIPYGGLGVKWKQIIEHLSSNYNFYIIGDNNGNFPETELITKDYRFYQINDNIDNIVEPFIDTINLIINTDLLFFKKAEYLSKKYNIRMGQCFDAPFNHFLKDYKNDEEKIHIRKLCSRNKPIKVIDFINKKIRLCNTTFTQNPTIELNEENLKQLNNPKEIDNPICEKCDNLYYPVGHIFYNQDKYEPDINIIKKWNPCQKPIIINNLLGDFIWQIDIQQCNIYMKKQLLGDENG